MSYQTTELELLENLKSLSTNQKDDVLTLVKKMSAQNLLRVSNRKTALKEIRAALKNKRF